MEKESIVSTLIEEGSSFEGRLSYSGTAKIAGQFKGEIFTRDQLIISETAQVVAEVEASYVILKGQFEGNIIAHSKVVMIPPANFRGTVTTPSLKIEEGVVFEGASYIPKA
ncbi:MAG: polymer-forming cytoskeletal protein [Bdellovibrionaceae bacterium]|nr:polymer-forming cytoskeletal protein [Bdellovibrio sp.]